ncbi:HNH endonuclease, partial [Specibacter sp. AOP5-B1-6]|uniref:HNH endonuclease n=1 Tax=Specibacter sp. AOP5-B1-6 TaxID=3457653 RepID=UPI00402BE0D7
MSWVVLHIPTLAAEAIMVHCHRVASAIKSDAAGRQRAADAAGGGEDCREYRTREQIRADVAAVLLMGQELPNNSYTNPTTNHHSNNNNSGSRGYGGTGGGGYNGQGNGNSSYNGQGAGNGAGNDFTSDGSRGGQGAGRDGRPNNNFSNTPGSGSSGGFTGNGATQGGGTSGNGAAPGGGSTGGTSGSSGSCNSEGPGAGGDGGVPFGEKTAFGVTLFDEEPVWAHSDPAPPRTNTSTSPTTGPETSPAGEAVLPDVDQPIGGTVVPDGAGPEPLNGTIVPDEAGPGRVDGTGLPNTPNQGQDPGQDPGQPSGQPAGQSSGQPSSQNPDQQSGQGSGLGGVGLEDVPLCGELVGDGSGYVDEIVDGIVEDRQQEYLDQLEAMRRGKVMVDPPLPRAQILLKVPFLGLVGVTDEPAELVGEGVGPVPLGIARKLMAGESTFLRVLTDPVTGQALPLSPQQYTLRDAEKAVLQALAGGCYFLNCSNPVVLTDIDHLQAWEHGGKSTWENLRPACAAHHR